MNAAPRDLVDLIGLDRAGGSTGCSTRPTGCARRAAPPGRRSRWPGRPRRWCSTSRRCAPACRSPWACTSWVATPWTWAPSRCREHGRENLPDVAHVLSGMCDLIVVRTFAHALVTTLARHRPVPIINALTDYSHPCQILADLYTLRRMGRDLDALTIAWVGDGNNVLHQLARGGDDLRVHVARRGARRLRAGRRPVARGRAARPRPGACACASRSEAVRDADMVYTDTWTSMGHEAEAEWRRISFSGFQVDERLMALAAPDAVFMHCLPAHRGEEVTDEVIDGPQSIVIEQAENRLHLQKALMAMLVQPRREASRARVVPPVPAVS